MIQGPAVDFYQLPYTAIREVEMKNPTLAMKLDQAPRSSLNASFESSTGWCQGYEGGCSALLASLTQKQTEERSC